MAIDGHVMVFAEGDAVGLYEKARGLSSLISAYSLGAVPLEGGDCGRFGGTRRCCWSRA